MHGRRSKAKKIYGQEEKVKENCVNGIDFQSQYKEKWMINGLIMHEIHMLMQTMIPQQDVFKGRRVPDQARYISGHMGYTATIESS